MLHEIMPKWLKLYHKKISSLWKNFVTPTVWILIQITDDGRKLAEINKYINKKTEIKEKKYSKRTWAIIQHCVELMIEFSFVKQKKLKITKS